jgi:hypothetical protein
MTSGQILAAAIPACAIFMLFLLSMMALFYVGYAAHVRRRFARDKSPRIAEWTYKAQTLPVVSLWRIFLSASQWTAFLVVVVTIQTWLTKPDRGALFREGLPFAAPVIFVVLFVLILVSRLIDRIMATQPTRFILTEEGLFVFGRLPVGNLPPFLSASPSGYVFWNQIHEAVDRGDEMEIRARGGELYPFRVAIPDEGMKRLIQERIVAASGKVVTP